MFSVISLSPAMTWAPSWLFYQAADSQSCFLLYPPRAGTLILSGKTKPKGSQTLIFTLKHLTHFQSWIIIFGKMVQGSVWMPSPLCCFLTVWPLFSYLRAGDTPTSQVCSKDHMNLFGKGQPVPPGKNKSWCLLQAHNMTKTGPRALLILTPWIITTTLRLSLQALLRGMMSKLPLERACVLTM